ncbi:NitT/TauT family transport system permease protein [Labrenzia sp. EL_208]|nr:NitT/TauT family transport system permease protein [Labrenzia sp. EL_132]MBG6227696.1 NitT/TauT family transport system permease protein [Labrenzia sp. EL_208]
MARRYEASPFQAFYKIRFWAALPEIPGGVRIGVIRAVKRVIVGQLLISIVLFALTFSVTEFPAYLERRVSYDTAKR